MKRFTFVLMAMSLAGGFAACGGKDVKKDQQAGGTLGAERVSTGEAEITTKKQVTRTITSTSELPTVRETTVKGDINRMAPSHFTALGYPQGVAESIVEYRDDNGPFASVDELRNVEGVSAELLNKTKDKLGASR